MALTKAHNRMIEGAAVNVKDFGAKGDGVTDDTTAIQAAITYAETFNVTTNKGGRRVFIPAGEYVISSTITLAKNKLCQLVGEGQLLTTLSYTGSGVAVEVLGDNTGQNQSFYMADLQIANDGSGTKGCARSGWLRSGQRTDLAGGHAALQEPGSWHPWCRPTELRLRVRAQPPERHLL